MTKSPGPFVYRLPSFGSGKVLWGSLALFSLAYGCRGSGPLQQVFVRPKKGRAIAWMGVLWGYGCGEARRRHGSCTIAYASCFGALRGCRKILRVHILNVLEHFLELLTFLDISVHFLTFPDIPGHFCRVSVPSGSSGVESSGGGPGDVHDVQLRIRQGRGFNHTGARGDLGPWARGPGPGREMEDLAVR